MSVFDEDDDEEFDSLDGDSQWEVHLTIGSVKGRGHWMADKHALVSTCMCTFVRA